MMNSNRYILLFLLLAGEMLFGQLYVRGSMGISFFTAPAMKDYLNFNYAPADQQVNTFSTSVEFAGEAGYISGGYSYAAEFAYFLNSYTYPFIASQYEFGYGILAPSVIVSSVTSGKGYNLRLGAGAGPRFTTVEETIPGSNVKKSFTSAGVGFLVKAEGNTALSENLYAYIAGDIRYDMNGEPEKDGKGMTSLLTPENLSMNIFSFGIKLGVSYIF
ncbi:MAG: hypothetical protein HRU80_15845 [Ignavibacteriales bacterium]|nr:MAG: hypothetical protein HRU80_15845 [Ignavibacteriales bacterium]